MRRGSRAALGVLAVVVAAGLAACTSSSSPPPAPSTATSGPTTGASTPTSGPATSPSSGPLTSPSSGPVTSPSSGSPTSGPHSTPTSGSPSTGSSTPPPVVTGHLHIADYSVVGNDVWVLGSAACGNARCAELLRSTDGGSHYSPLPAPPATVGTRSHVRFATPQVGYLFGVESTAAGGDTLLMTMDGGRTWTSQAGGADALESLDGNVIRVVDHGGCPPGCRYTVRLSRVGGTHWHSAALPGNQGVAVSVQLVRTGESAAIEIYGNPAGGGNARAVLYTSSDDGHSWTRRGEPCPQSSGRYGEVDSSRLTSAPDGSISVLCTPREPGRFQFTVTSTDGGATFRTANQRALGGAPVSGFASATAQVLVVSSDDLYRSVNSGGSFSRLAGTGTLTDPGMVTDIGFATAEVGHAIGHGRRALWTTRDGGQSWHRHVFG